MQGLQIKTNQILWNLFKILTRFFNKIYVTIHYKEQTN